MGDFQQLLNENTMLYEKKEKKPKRPPNAFNLFFMEQMPKIKLNFPELSGGEISKQLGEKWKKMSKEEKKEYQDQALQIRQQFRIENPDFHYEKGPNAKSKKKKNALNDSIAIQKSIVQLIEPYILWIGAHALNQYFINNEYAAQLYNQKASQKTEIPLELE